MTRRQQALAKIQEALEASPDWQADGETATQEVRIPTREAPVGNRGKSGGKLTTLGGRTRYRRGDRFVTIGQRTTYFWTKGQQDGKAFDTMIEDREILAKIAEP